MATLNKREFIAKQVGAIIAAEKKGDAVALTGLVKGYGEMAYAVAKDFIDLGEDAKRFAFDLHKARKADGNVSREEPSASDVSLLRGVLRIGKRAWHSEWFANVEKLNAKAPVSDTILKRIAGETLKTWEDKTHAPGVEWLMNARTLWLKKSKGKANVEGIKRVNPLSAAKRTVKEYKMVLRQKDTPADVKEYFATALRSSEKIVETLEKAEKAAKAAKAKADAAAKAEKGKGK